LIIFNSQKLLKNYKVEQLLHANQNEAYPFGQIGGSAGSCSNATERFLLVLIGVQEQNQDRGRLLR
jgi:hypothetical protein